MDVEVEKNIINGDTAMTVMVNGREVDANEFKMEVGKYAEDTANNSGTAKKFNVTRGSVQNWRKQYLTGSRK